MRAKAASAANMPVFIALWLPLMRGKLTKPAAQPIKEPPGQDSFGQACSTLTVQARAVLLATWRPTHGVHDQARLVLDGIDLPEFFQADGVFLRIDAVTQLEA